MPGIYFPEEEDIQIEVSPRIQEILDNPDLTLREKRKLIDKELGLRKPRKKYATEAERKAAAAERSKQRRSGRASTYEHYGLGRGPRVELTPEQKKERRKRRRQDRRSLESSLAAMAKAHPEIAREHGIDPNKIRVREPKSEE